MKDDGIQFQWGDRFIKSPEVIEGVGGKYWRQNSDGTITQFDPPELRFKKIISSIINDYRRPTRDFIVIDRSIVFQSETLAAYYERKLKDTFWKDREINVARSGKVLEFSISESVLEDTYVPG